MLFSSKLKSPFATRTDKSRPPSFSNLKPVGPQQTILQDFRFSIINLPSFHKQDSLSSVQLRTLIEKILAQTSPHRFITLIFYQLMI